MHPTPEHRRRLAARLNYYREMGIYDFYRREGGGPRPAVPVSPDGESAGEPPVLRMTPPGQMTPLAKSGAAAQRVAASSGLFDPAKPEAGIADHAAALRVIREDLGDCTRCVLHKQGRKQIVFGTGNPNAELMFVGEGPGADEDEQGEPFVGRAGQLLNKMIEAMGLKREQVYIANIVKCRPPGNRTPEKEECDTCSPFLLRQIAVIQPKVIVALGAVAARTLLGLNEPMAKLRGHLYDFRGSRLAVTYHPAYLLRDPRQKKEAWKDLQTVMHCLGLRSGKTHT